MNVTEVKNSIVRQHAAGMRIILDEIKIMITHLLLCIFDTSNIALINQILYCP